VQLKRNKLSNLEHGRGKRKAWKMDFCIKIYEKLGISISSKCKLSLNQSEAISNMSSFPTVIPEKFDENKVNAQNRHQGNKFVLESQKLCRQAINPKSNSCMEKNKAFPKTIKKLSCKCVKQYKKFVDVQKIFSRMLYQNGKIVERNGEITDRRRNRNKSFTKKLAPKLRVFAATGRKKMNYKK